MEVSSVRVLLTVRVMFSPSLKRRIGPGTEWLTVGAFRVLPSIVMVFRPTVRCKLFCAAGGICPVCALGAAKMRVGARAMSPLAAPRDARKRRRVGGGV